MNPVLKMTTTTDEVQLICGDRSARFAAAIVQLLKKSGMRVNNIKIMTNVDNIRIYASAFTHKTYDAADNYEYYEIVGDAIVNTCILLYLKERFPYINKNPDYVRIMARLKNMLQSKKSFSGIMADLDLWEFVSANYTTKTMNQKKISEDIFESFFGATFIICEQHYKSTGTAFNIVYNIVKKIFDTIEISLKYEDIYDAKSRLKELFDVNKNIGKIKYTRQTVGDNMHKVVIMLHLNTGPVQFLATGRALLLIDAQQIAAEHALRVLQKRGIFRHIPPAFLQLYKESIIHKKSEGETARGGVKRQKLTDVAIGKENCK